MWVGRLTALNNILICEVRKVESRDMDGICFVKWFVLPITLILSDEHRNIHGREAMKGPSVFHYMHNNEFIGIIMDAWPSLSPLCSLLEVAGPMLWDYFTLYKRVSQSGAHRPHQEVAGCGKWIWNAKAISFWPDGWLGISDER